jgi:hypothetical protein
MSQGIAKLKGVEPMVASSGYGQAVADELASDPIMRREPSMACDVTSNRRDSQIRRAPSSAGLYEVLDLILDKGIVIDAFVRVSLVGIELLTVDLRVVIASVDTYLRYAEGVERLQVYNRSGAKRLPDMVGAGSKTNVLKKGAEKVSRVLGHDDSDDEDRDSGEHEGIAGTLTRGVKKVVGRIVGGGEDDESGGEQQREHRQPQPRGAERRHDRNSGKTRGNGR